MKKLLLSIAALAVMTSCVKDQVVNTPEANPIAFLNHIQYTKAPVYPSFDNDENKLPAFYVWGFMGAPTGVVFNKELVSYDENAAAWTYSNVAYWATNKSYKFAALAPVNNDKIEVTLANGNYLSEEGSLGTVTFENEDGTVDLLYAESNVTTTSTIPADLKAQLTFNHLLSKVKFTFTNNLVNENSTIVISNVQMVAPAKGSVDLSTAPNYAWNVEQGTTTLAFGGALNADNQSNLASNGGVGVVENERLTIPLVASESYEVTFDVTIYYGDQEGQTISKSATITNKALVAGKSYNFTATLTAENLELQKIDFDVLVDNWVEEGDTNLLN